MKPINKKERTALYWKFLGLYVISILLVILSVYFNNETNKVAGDELKKIREERKVLAENTKVFFGKMNKVDSLLKSMEDPKANTDRLSDDIKLQISDMKALVSSNPSINDSVFIKIYDRYYDVLQDKKLIQGSNASSNAVSVLQLKLQKANADLDLCTKQLTAANAMAPSLK